MRSCFGKKPASAAEAVSRSSPAKIVRKRNFKPLEQCISNKLCSMDSSPTHSARKSVGLIPSSTP